MQIFNSRTMASSLYDRGYLDIWTGICFDGYKYHDSLQVHFKEEIGNYCNNFGSQNHKLFAFFHFCNVFFFIKYPYTAFISAPEIPI